MTQSATLARPTAVYTAVRDEYTAAVEGAGIADRSHLGRLKVSGADAIDLLNRLSTNKLDDLQIGDIQGTVLTTNKGRIIDLLYVLRQDDHLLIITGPDTCRQVAEWIDFYTFVEDVEVEDVSDATAQISLIGGGAADALPQLADIPAYSAAAVSIGEVDALALRTDALGGFGCELIVSTAQQPALWDALKSLGATPVGEDALELLRIRNAIPDYGSELCEDYNPLEANLKRFISFNKGCYIGQEVVARLNTYDKVQRHLAQVSLQGAVEVPAELPADLLHDGRKVGALTTAAAHPDGDIVGLAYVRKAHASAGARLIADGVASVIVEHVPHDDE